MKLSDSIIPFLQCPSCGSSVVLGGSELTCQNATCGSQYAVFNGIPILVSQRWREIPPERYLAAMKETNSGFSATKFVRAITPSIYRGEKRKSVIMRLHDLLKEKVDREAARILVIANLKLAPEFLLFDKTGEVDVIHLGTIPGMNESDILCEIGGLPFHDSAFDAVVIHSALHKTFATTAAVKEIIRVLRQDGYIYAEEPFMEPILNGPYDFYRFSHLGLRGLFSECDELESGIINGVGTALAAIWSQFLSCFPSGRRSSFLFFTFGKVSSFFLKQIDKFIVKRPRTYNAPSSVFFLGQRGANSLSFAELVAGYRGTEKQYYRLHETERPASEVFTEWAAKDRDYKMQDNHAVPVNEMLSAAFEVLDTSKGFTAIDAGCGNGWIIRQLQKTIGCVQATGVDGSAGMIAKAHSIDPQGHYILADLVSWEPSARVDLVVSMEVLYYFADPLTVLRQIATKWLKPGGYAVFGIDHYQENETSLHWPKNVGVYMTTWPEAKWLSTIADAGFTCVRTWRAAPSPGWAGTLVMLVRAPTEG